MGVRITDLTLRDAHQSLFATRMRTRDMLPILELIDEVGFFSVEMWGGATFDACIRFLNEDPWERAREIKKRLKKTPTQMLLRGQNIVGYKHYSDDIVEKFVILASKYIDIFRVFDAMNDIRNMEVAIKTAKKMGAHVQGAISYTTSPVHTIDFFVDFAKELAAMECDSICIKDMSGIIAPRHAYELVRRLKKEISLPIDLHSHYTSGMAQMSYYAACEAGVDILDCVFSPLALGTSFPPVESMVYALKSTPYDTNLDLELLVEISKYFEKVRKKYSKLINPVAERIDVNVLIHQIPGGMLSNLVAQLKEQNALDKFEEVLKEVPRVRADLGYPPLVTPTSQVVGIQAVLNVLYGERYKVITKEVKEYAKGMYGRIPGKIDEKLKRKILGEEKEIICRPADLLQNNLQKIAEETKAMGIIKSEEDLITYALFPQVAAKFLRGEIEEEKLEIEEEKEIEAIPKDAVPNEFKVIVEGEEYNVKVIPTGYAIEKTAETEKKEHKNCVKAPMQGIVLKIKVKVGDNVKKGDVIATIEAMKMENEIKSDRDGVVKEILVKEGEIVSANQCLIAFE